MCLVLLLIKWVNKMRFVKITSAVLMASMLSASASAVAGDFYGSIAAGYSLDSKAKAKFINGSSFAPTKASKGFAGAVGFGYYFMDEVRADVTFALTPSNSSKKNGAKVKIASYTGLVNAYYDFTGAEIIPYVTAGIGATSRKVKYSDTSTNKYSFKNKTGFAYQAGLGAAYDVASGVKVDLGYRYTAADIQVKDKATGNKITTKGAHSFLLGLRADF